MPTVFIELSFLDFFSFSDFDSAAAFSVEEVLEAAFLVLSLANFKVRMASFSASSAGAVSPRMASVLKKEQRPPRISM